MAPTTSPARAASIVARKANGLACPVMVSISSTTSNAPRRNHEIAVVRPDYKVVPSSITIYQRETRWGFSPAGPRQAGLYRILISASLEDVSGNRTWTPFDVVIPAGEKAIAANITSFDECLFLAQAVKKRGCLRLGGAARCPGIPNPMLGSLSSIRQRPECSSPFSWCRPGRAAPFRYLRS